MTVFVAMLFREAAYVFSDTVGNTIENEVKYQDKVYTFPTYDMVTVASGSVAVTKQFNFVLDELVHPHGIDKLIAGDYDGQYGLGYFMAAHERAWGEYHDLTASHGLSLEEADPRSQNQMVCIGYSRREGQFVAVELLNTSSEGLTCAVKRPNGFVANSDGGISLRDHVKSTADIIPSMHKFIQGQYRRYCEIRENPNGCGGLVQATVMRRGQIAQELVAKFPNHESVAQEIGVQPREMADAAAATSAASVGAAQPAQPGAPRAHSAGSSAGKPQRKPGRNDPCPCGSGRKAKKCCGA